ncbi:major facilitator superfamily MFS_1 [candidate division TM7 genomosp. GTL1]|nr:major facilitator superfamily MFS_1 [candidate division TM7 genomosp. GTL1]
MSEKKIAGARYVLPASAVVFLLCIAQFLDGMDVSSMGVVLPVIQRELGMGAQSLQWIVSGYVLGYGGFLLLGGRVADLFGRRRVFLISMLVFGLASLAGGLATEGWMLIAARIVKGICAGFTGPAALSLLLGLFQDPAKRNAALGTFSSVGALGFALGQVIGGFLGDISWRFTMLLPVPVAFVVVILGMLTLTRDAKTQGAKQFDLVGAVTGTLALLSIVFGATQAATFGWISAAALIPLGIGLALFIAFLAYEKRAKTPLMPLEIFRRPGLGYASALGLFIVGNYIAFQFIAVLYMQIVLHWSAFQSSLAFVFGGLIVVFAATRFARLALRIGAVPLIVAGFLAELSGFSWFLLLDNIPSVLLVVVMQILIGTGFAMAYPAINIQGLSGAHQDEHGLASGIILSSFQVGGGIILAIVASVFAASSPEGLIRYQNGLIAVVTSALLAISIAAYGWQRIRKGRLSMKHFG